MNKKLKFSLFGFAGLVVAGTAAGVTAGVLLNQNQTSLNSNNISNGSSSVIQNNTTEGYSLRTVFNAETQTFSISVKNAKSGLGVLKLINPENITNKLSNPGLIEASDIKNALVDTITAKANDKVYVVVFTEQGVEARNLKVFGANPNIMLATEKLDTPTPLFMDGGSANLFSFQLPEKVEIVNGEQSQENNDVENGMEEPGFPIDSEGHITVTATYVKSQVAGWTYNYNYKSYVLDLHQDAVLNDSDPMMNIAQAVANGDLETSKLDTIPFVVFLNGHDLKVGTFTIPSGVTLYIINSKDNPSSKSEDVKNIELADNKNGKVTNYGFILEGVIANYSDVKITAPIMTIQEWKDIYDHYQNGDYNFKK